MVLLETPVRRLLSSSLIAFGGEGSATSKTVLMFSGGRDSTIAALRMYDQGLDPILVTVSSAHLIGIERVKERMREIERYLPRGTLWLVIRQPAELKTDTSFYEQTCLPCHHAYIVAGAAVAAKAGVKALAFGYAAYQNTWPEQTPLAVERLSAVLSRHGIKLTLPAYDLASRKQAFEELLKRGLSTEALEQKCLQQVTNVALDSNRLSQQVDLWERAINNSISSISAIEIEIVESALIGAR
jgi:hypothetical protein